MNLTRLRDALLKLSKPYSHLYHADGSLYMERFHLIEWKLRLHHIVTEDRDPHFHDHPWDFVSLVLTGAYVEARPIDRDPCFNQRGWEQDVLTDRLAGSFAYRRSTDRHRIVYVQPDTWTLFYTGPLRQWWGFYTPSGKIYHKDYESVHSDKARHVL